MHEYLFYHCTYVFHLFLFFLSSFFIVYIYYFILCSIEKNSNEKKCTRTKRKFIYFIRDRSYELILTPRSLVRLSEIVIKNIYIYIFIYIRLLNLRIQTRCPLCAAFHVVTRKNRDYTIHYLS